MDHPGKIQSVENTVAILEFLATDGSSNLTTIADEIGLSESTTHYYLSTLLSHNIVRKDGTDYYLGYKLLEYGGVVKSRNQLYRYAKPLMDRISIETGLAVYLGIEDQHEVVHVASVSIDSTSIIGDYDGKRTKFHSAALGKAILAYLPEERRQEIIADIDFPKFTKKTITSADDLEFHLDTVKEQEYAINDEEDFEGWKGIAVPILSEDNVEGAISVAGPKSKIDNQKDQIIQLLKEAKDEIELNFNVKNI